MKRLPFMILAFITGYCGLGIFIDTPEKIKTDLIVAVVGILAALVIMFINLIYDVQEKD